MNNKGESDERAFAAMRWKGRTHFNFLAGRSRLRALPVVVHLLPNDIDWFSKVNIRLWIMVQVCVLRSRTAQEILAKHDVSTLLDYNNTEIRKLCLRLIGSLGVDRSYPRVGCVG